MTIPNKILMVIAPREFRDEELLVPRTAFVQKGFQVDTVSTEVGTATGMLGAEEVITQTLDDVKPENYRAVVVVGGMGAPEFLFHNPRLHAILKAIAHQKGIIAGICLSGALPSLAGLARGKRSTVYETPDTLAILKEAGAVYTGDPVTVDDHVITANGPAAAEAFAEAILAALPLKPVASSLS